MQNNKINHHRIPQDILSTDKLYIQLISLRTKSIKIENHRKQIRPAKSELKRVPATHLEFAENLAANDRLPCGLYHQGDGTVHLGHLLLCSEAP